MRWQMPKHTRDGVFSGTRGRQPFSKWHYGVVVCCVTACAHSFRGLSTTMPYPVAPDLADEFLRFWNLRGPSRKERTSFFWMTVHMNGSSHQPHVHKATQFNAVYYVKVPPNSGDLVFDDPRGISSIDLTGVTTEASLEKDGKTRRPLPPFHSRVWRHTPREGDLILFPAWLRYVVPLHAHRLSMHMHVHPTRSLCTSRFGVGHTQVHGTVCTTEDSHPDY